MTASAAQERMQLGHAARGAGRQGEALAHYRSAVEQEPGSAEANSVYGLMLLQLGRADEAEAPLRKAVAIAPRHPALQMNLAQWLAQAGKPDEAANLVAGIVNAEPQHWWAWDRLGELKSQQGLFAEAARCFERASGLRPQDPSLLRKLAQALRDDGRAADAAQHEAAAERVARARLATLRQEAAIHEARGNWPALERTASAWVVAHARDPEGWRALAKAQSEAGYFARAKESFRHVLEFGVRDAAHLATYGSLCLSAFDYDDGAQALDEAEALDPECAAMLSAKATLLMVTGRYDEAQSYCRRAITKNRDDASAYKALALLTGGRLSPEELSALESLVGRGNLSLAERATGAYALADCREAQETPERAFAAYERANALARESGVAEGIAYDAIARRARTDAIIKLFGSVPAPVDGDASRRAVFIVGMPRSGTTLIESVVGAHSAVLACGERMPLRWITEELLARTASAPMAEIDADTWDRWRRAYWEGIPSGPGIAVVTDKNPWNFDAIGLIARLFPDARIIHVRRNPVETGFSIYRSQFSRALQFANRLEDIGHYYGEYARLMAHWSRVAPERFTTVQYEDFVREFDAAAPRLLEACGLDWEPACANFWESRRVIGTISTIQARRPLESRAGRAERYGSLLAPLEEALATAGVDLRTGKLPDLDLAGER
jgi:tetratricopeptide (TPR) repeat protein